MWLCLCFACLGLLGLIHEDLKAFLMNNVPRGKKAAKYVLGVADSKLGSAIQETLEITCSFGGLEGWDSEGRLLCCCAVGVS